MKDDAPLAKHALLLAAAFACVYLATSARHFLGGDPGEFATIAGAGGFAHPPGYPIYSLYLWLASLLPVSSPAHEAAMATALLGACAVGLFFLALRAWRVPPLPATFGAALFGLAPQVWLLHAIPEAFALNHLLVAAILLFSAPSSVLEGRKRMVALGLTAAAGIAHHHMIIWMIPVGLYGVWRAIDESDRPPGRTLLTGIGCLLVGFLPYGYLVWVTRMAPEAYHWREVANWTDLVDTFLRRDYGTFQLTLAGDQATALEQITRLGSEVVADLVFVAPILGIIGLVILLRRKDAPLAHMSVIASWLLSGPVFVSMIRRGVGGTDYLHLRKFHTQFEMLTVFFVAVGATWLASVISRRWLLGLLLGAVCLACALVAIPHLDRHTAPTVEHYLEDTFGSLPEDAVVVGTGDHNFFGANYLQRALGRRHDIDYVDAYLLAHRWYNLRATDRLDISYPYRGSDIDTDRLFERILATGRPLFVTGPFHDALLRGWPSSPIGTLIRIYPKSQPPPHPAAAFEKNRAMLRDFQVTPLPHAPPHTWSRFVLEDYASTWVSLTAALQQTGHPRLARTSSKIARRFAPWPPTN